MTGVGVIPNDRSELANALDLADRIEIAEIETGARPDPQIVAILLHHLMRNPRIAADPAALREAITQGWQARHQLQLIRENHNGI